jgi:hypothetical protein
MQLNLRKLDDRIQKLQEIRRIAADPEMVSMLFEFIAEDERPERMTSAKTEAAVAAGPADTDIVDQMMKGTDVQGSGLWSRRRA